MVAFRPPSELARCVRTTQARLLIRLVELCPSAQEPPGSEGGEGLPDECPDLRVGPARRLPASREELPAPPYGVRTVTAPGPALDADLEADADDCVFTAL